MLGNIFGREYDMHDRAVQTPKSPQQAQVDEHIDAFRHEMQKLKLVNQALWELLRDGARLKDEDLIAKMQEIDLRDGKEDGEITEGPLRCPDCGRVSASRHGRCLYCGTLFEKPLLG